LKYYIKILSFVIHSEEEREALKGLDFKTRVESNMKWAEAVAKDVILGDAVRRLLREYGSARAIPEEAAKSAMREFDLEPEHAVSLSIVLEQKEAERERKH